MGVIIRQAVVVELVVQVFLSLVAFLVTAVLEELVQFQDCQ
jgi:hypothetical protein